MVLMELHPHRVYTLNPFLCMMLRSIILVAMVAETKQSGPVSDVIIVNCMQVHFFNEKALKCKPRPHVAKRTHKIY